MAARVQDSTNLDAIIRKHIVHGEWVMLEKRPTQCPMDDSSRARHRHDKIEGAIELSFETRAVPRSVCFVP
jgi:hypothetical protein